MALSSSEVAIEIARARICSLADAARARCAGVALALALGLMSGCTAPTFAPDEEGGADLEGDGGSDERRTDPSEVADSGREQPSDSGDELQDAEGKAPDAGGGAQASAGCDGGACSSAEAGATSSTSDAGPSSVGSEAGSALDEVRAKWVGRYAARSAMFAFDFPFDGTARALSVVEIVPTPEGGLRMEEELCSYSGEWTANPAPVNSAVKYRFGGARGSAALQYDGERFSSEQFAVRVGYGSTPAGCSPGATISRQADQAWLSNGTCDCSRSNDVPTSARDCRVTDPDDDDQPGVSLSASLNETPLAPRVVQELRLRLLEGYRHGDRLYADRWFEDTMRLMSCVVDGAPAPASSCPLTPSDSCPSRHNKVELVPIVEPIKCAQVIAMEQALFLSPLPSFPTSCPSEIEAQRRP